MNIEEIIKEIDFLSSEIGYIGIDSIKDAHSGQQALDILKNRVEQKLPIHSVSKSFYCQSEIEGDGKCDKQCNHCKEYYKPLEQ